VSEHGVMSSWSSKCTTSLAFFPLLSTVYFFFWKPRLFWRRVHGVVQSLSFAGPLAQEFGGPLLLTPRESFLPGVFRCAVSLRKAAWLGYLSISSPVMASLPSFRLFAKPPPFCDLFPGAGEHCVPGPRGSRFTNPGFIYCLPPPVCVVSLYVSRLFHSFLDARFRAGSRH